MIHLSGVTNYEVQLVKTGLRLRIIALCLPAFHLILDSSRVQINDRRLDSPSLWLNNVVLVQPDACGTCPD